MCGLWLMRRELALNAVVLPRRLPFVWVGFLLLGMRRIMLVIPLMLLLLGTRLLMPLMLLRLLVAPPLPALSIELGH